MEITPELIEVIRRISLETAFIGPRGKRGKQGPPGEQGLQGAQGLPGTNGTNGTVIPYSFQTTPLLANTYSIGFSPLPSLASFGELAWLTPADGTMDLLTFIFNGDFAEGDLVLNLMVNGSTIASFPPSTSGNLYQIILGTPVSRGDRVTLSLTCNAAGTSVSFWGSVTFSA